MKVITTSLIILLLVGCANLATGPKFKPEIFDKSNYAVVYVYWPISANMRFDHITAFGSSADVTLDFIPIGSAKVGGYISKVIEPGEHSIYASSAGITNSEANIPIVFKAEAGKEYYFAFISGDIDFSESAEYGLAVIPIDKYVFKQIDSKLAVQAIYRSKSSNK